MIDIDISLIWIIGIGTYGIFIAWYHNWRGALRPHEIAHYTARLAKSPSLDDATRAVMQKFMQDDTGREFLMLNLIRLHPHDVEHPHSGQKISPIKLVSHYFRPFMRQIIKRAGHPAYMARVAIPHGYIEAWGVEENVGWRAVGIVRYRSRRDMLAVTTDERFHNIHSFKIPALANTLALPMETQSAFMLTPRIWVGLLIFAVCAVLT